MTQTINLLENALCAWEDLFLIYEARVRTGVAAGTRSKEELLGPVRHWRELRNHLLSLAGADFDVARFCHGKHGTGLLSGIGREIAAEYLHIDTDMPTPLDGLYESLPLQLASWTISSRRVFNLSNDMVERFLAADYSRYTWSDLLWPFDSFFLSFESPVTADDSEIGGLLVSSVYGVCPDHKLAAAEGFECLTFHTKADGDYVLPEQILTPQERMRFENDIRQKRWIKLNRRIGSTWSRFLNIDPNEALRAYASGDPSTVAQASMPFHPPAGYAYPVCWDKHAAVQSGDAGQIVGKIIAGLCLYLEALPAGSVDTYSWRQTASVTAKRDLRKIVTDGAQVCEVADFHTLSPETMTLFPQTLREGPAYSVTPHWRRAHYRRRPGSGPDAPRDVEVRSALIHKDQLPKGAVPGGAMSTVI